MKHHAKLNLQAAVIEVDQEGFWVEADLSILLIPLHTFSLLKKKSNCVA